MKVVTIKEVLESKPKERITLKEWFGDKSITQGLGVFGAFLVFTFFLIFIYFLLSHKAETNASIDDFLLTGVKFLSIFFQHFLL